MAKRGFGGARLGLLAALAVPLAACVVQPTPVYQPYGATTAGSEPDGATPVRSTVR